MKRIGKIRLITLLAVEAVFVVFGVVLLCLSLFKESIFAFIPIPFTVGIFFTFFLSEEKADSAKSLIGSIVIRFLFIALALFIPVIIYRYVPSFYDSMSGYWIFGSFAEVMITYIMSNVASHLQLKASEKSGETEKKE